MKGFQRLIPIMRLLPEVDLRIAGTGPYEGYLRDLARDLPNVHFEGLLSGEQLRTLFHGARGVVVPSLFPGDVRLRRARSLRRPYARRRSPGRRRCSAKTAWAAAAAWATRPTPNCCWPSGGSFTTTICAKPWPIAATPCAPRSGPEAAHLDRYFELIRNVRAMRGGSRPHHNSRPERARDADQDASFASHGE